MDAAISTAGKMIINIECPEIGRAYSWFAPEGTTPPTAEYTKVFASYTDWLDEYLADQASVDTSDSTVAD